jgi:hypothetical protein
MLACVALDGLCNAACADMVHVLLSVSFLQPSLSLRLLRCWWRSSTSREQTPSTPQTKSSA